MEKGKGNRVGKTLSLWRKPKKTPAIHVPISDKIQEKCCATDGPTGTWGIRHNTYSVVGTMSPILVCVGSVAPRLRFP